MLSPDVLEVLVVNVDSTAKIYIYIVTAIPFKEKMMMEKYCIVF